MNGCTRRSTVGDSPESRHIRGYTRRGDWSDGVLATPEAAKKHATGIRVTDA